MIRLKTKLALFNLLSKLVFTALFLAFLPWIVERVNLRQVDKNLILKREKTIELIGRIGIEPFINSDTAIAFGSYNILKEEFISIERTNIKEELNYIDVSDRLIDNEVITYRVLSYTLLVDGQKYLLEIGESLASIQNARKNITRVILVFLAFIIAITLFTDLQYTRFVLQPLKKITGKLKEISNPSAFDKKPVRTNTTDFASLDGALTELMTQIDELFRKEKEITINISHELLTPVSILRSKLENILLREDIDAETINKIDESLTTLHRLQSLINSLLLISRIESHQYLQNESFSLCKLLDEIAGELKPIAGDKGVTIKIEYRIDHTVEQANRTLMFSMFYNVINNAVKHTETGGDILISVQQDEGKLTVKIADTGKGMTDDQLNMLFERFKARQDNREDGTGIGLAIAKTIADLHKIRIEVFSRQGKGSVFSFIFP